MSEKVFLLNEDRSFRVEYTHVEAELEAEHGLWTEDEPPQPMWAPFYQGGQVNPQTHQVIGGVWVELGGPAAPTLAEIEQLLVAQFNDFLDSVAGQRRYDNRWTCALRAGYPGAFQAEGQIFAAWMDACNMIAYGVMAEVKAGRAEVPSQAELVAMMPEIQWPPSPIPEGAV